MLSGKRGSTPKRGTAGCFLHDWHKAAMPHAAGPHVLAMASQLSCLCSTQKSL